MTNNLPAAPRGSQLESPGPGGAPPVPEFAVDRTPEDSGKVDWRRYLSAVLRYKWLVMLVVGLGTAAGVAATRFIKPEYVAQATIWIESAQGRGQAAGPNPIRTGNLLESSGWIDLLRSFFVLDYVVLDQRLYLQPRNPADSLALAGFKLKEQFIQGSYRLEVDEKGRRFTLKTTTSPTALQAGAVGDSVGPARGFLWVPAAGTLRPGSTIEFTLSPPRDVALQIGANLVPRLGVDGNFMKLELRGSDAARVAATLNAITHRYIDVAAELKREKISQLSKILNEQLTAAQNNLRDAEGALQSFRVNTITLPGGPGAPLTPGLVMTANPVYQSFFQMRIERDQLRRDREAIVRALGQSSDSGVGGISADALRLIGAVTNTELEKALGELTNKEAELRAQRFKYTDQAPQVQRLLGDVRVLKTQTVPTLARSLVSQILQREQDLDDRIGSASAELKQIPTRTIEEGRLERHVATATNLYTTLRQRYEEARLAEASSVPDIRILDDATVPQQPQSNTSSRIIFMALIGSLALGLAGAVLLDRIDSRLRYPSQVSQEMGLGILGAVPRVKNGSASSGIDAQQVVEALRGIRLNLLHAYGSAGPIMLTVSSPGAGDGKSFIASNLALAFADAGHKTLLIDGDIRRGGLHRVMSAPRKPGLTDYLSGTATREQIVRATSYTGLSFIPCGTRTQSGPELLGAAAMTDLITRMRPNFNVILIDSPPLGAGVDPFVLGTVTGSMLIVLRTGVTDREMAEAKLDMLDRLPIRILGAVLNDVREGGAYRYCSYYLSGYEASDEMRADAKQLPEPQLRSAEKRSS